MAGFISGIQPSGSPTSVSYLVIEALILHLERTYFEPRPLRAIITGNVLVFHRIQTGKCRNEMQVVLGPGQEALKANR
jgi:hypothetical protein